MKIQLNGNHYIALFSKGEIPSMENIPIPLFPFHYCMSCRYNRLKEGSIVYVTQAHDSANRVFLAPTEVRYLSQMSYGFRVITLH